MIIRPTLHDSVWAAGILVILVMSVFQVYDVVRRLDIVLESGKRELHSTVRMLAGHASATLQAADLLLQESAAAAEGQLASNPSLQKRLREPLASVPQVRDLLVVRQDSGQRSEAAPEAALPSEVRGLLRERPGSVAAPAQLSAPFLMPESRQRTAALSRPFKTSKGRNGGWLVAYLDLPYFERFYASLDLPAGSRVYLLGNRGELFVESPAAPAGTPESGTVPAVSRNLLASVGAGARLVSDPLDGSEHIHAAEAVPGFALAIGITTAKSALLAPWYVQSMHSAARTASLCASVALLMWLVLRQLRRREQTEARLRVQTASLDELFESAPEAIAMLDLQGGIARVNREFTRLFGYTAEEARGQSLEQLIAPDELEQESQRMTLAAREGQHVISETERARSDGSRLMVSALSAPIVDAAGPMASYAIFRDITERRYAEAERAKLQSRLRQAEKLEAIGTMAGGIAHDFNGILSAIVGYANLALQNAHESAPMQRHLTGILSAASRGQGIVDQILTYSRSTRGKRVLVKVYDLLQDSLELVRAALPANVALKTRLTAQNAHVVADPSHIHQLVMNLCSNAVHSMEDGGNLEVELHQLDGRPSLVSHGALTHLRYLVLCVRDSGGGIPAALVDRIFEPFFTTGHAAGGTGLGLAMVYAIMTELHGAIDVQTAVGAGSTFTLYLPAADPPALNDVEEETGLPRGDGQRVLLVEDDQALMLLEEEMLAALNYEPAGFVRAPLALTEYLFDPSRFEVALLDQLMPEMTGIELARRLRAVRDDLPIILITGHGGIALAPEARAAGIQEILFKPLDFRLLARALRRALMPSAASRTDSGI